MSAAHVRIRADDSAAGFEAFYLATCERIFKTACRLTAGDQYLARDVTQEAYVAMWRCWSARWGRPVEDNRRYVLGIVSKKIVDWYRAPDNKCAGLDEVDCQPDEPTPADLIGEWAVLHAVRKLLADQPERRRAVGMLFFLEGWQYEEIATALGMQESTVRTHVHRLRGLLKSLIYRINDLDLGGDLR